MAQDVKKLFEYVIIKLQKSIEIHLIHHEILQPLSD